MAPTTSPTTPPPVTHLGDYTYRGSCDSTDGSYTYLKTIDYIKGYLCIANGACTTITLDKLKGVGGYLRISDNAQLTSFSANSLKEIGGYHQGGKGIGMEIYRNAELGVLNLNSLERINYKGGDRIFIPRSGSNKVDLCSTRLQNICLNTVPEFQTYQPATCRVVCP